MAQLKSAFIKDILKKADGGLGVAFDFEKILTPSERNRLLVSIRRFGQVTYVDFVDEQGKGITHVFVHMARTHDGQLLADYITGVIKKIPSKAHILSAQFPQLYVAGRSPSANEYQVSLMCKEPLSHGEQQNACAAFLHTFGKVTYLYMAEDYCGSGAGFVSVHYKEKESAEKLIEFLTP